MIKFALVIVLSISPAISFAALDFACSENRGNSALVVIDMQSFFVEAKGPRVYKKPENIKKLNAALEAQTESIKKAKAAKIPIIFIEYEDSEGHFNYGKTNDTLQSAAADYRDVVIIKKTTDGMFDRDNKHLNQIKKFLQSRNIGTLIMTGANGGACVHASIEGAIKNNCNVVAYSQGIADFNYKDFIYPYQGKYDGVSMNCKNCSFKEISSAESLENYMVSSEKNNSESPKASRQLKSSKGKR